jgi:hypothetical protein
MCPSPTLQVRGCPPPSHGRGQDGSLFLLLYDSFIHYFTPVYPDAIQINNLPHIGIVAAREETKTSSTLVWTLAPQCVVCSIVRWGCTNRAGICIQRTMEEGL